MGCVPINGFRGTSWLRDISEWYEVVKDYTFPTIPWTDYVRRPRDWDCPVVLKTREKSFKEQWSTSMFAETTDDARDVFTSIISKGIDPEDVFVRKFVPLASMGEHIPGACPVSEEYRFFVLDNMVLDVSSYWPEQESDPREVPLDFLDSVTNKIRGGGPSDLRFYVLDVARTTNGGWVLVEINDGCSAGLCQIDPKRFYARLQERLS